MALDPWGNRDEYTESLLSDRPAWLPAYQRTPEEYWAGIESGRAPFWSTRAPLGDVGERLRGRYLLAAPEMASRNFEPTFGQYFEDWTPYAKGGFAGTAPSYFAPAGSGMLRSRAAEAAKAAMTAPGQYLEGFSPEDAGFERRAWLSSQFGPGAENAAANQRAVANLLALQRPAGGTYGGQMASAIRNAMYNLQQRRSAVGDPKGAFLDWYLTQTGQEGEEG